MGTASLVFGIVGVCLSWLPVVGWLGMALGAAACALGLPSITHWFARPGYTAWGIAGILLGTTAVGLSLAYQIKHAAGALDMLVHPLPAPGAYLALGLLSVLAAAGIVAARRRRARFGVVVAALAIAALGVSVGWALTTADRELQQRPQESVSMEPETR